MVTHKAEKNYSKKELNVSFYRKKLKQSLMTEIMRQYADLQSNDSIMIKEYFKIDSGVGYIYCSLFGSEILEEKGREDKFFIFKFV